MYSCFCAIFCASRVDGLTIFTLLCWSPWINYLVPFHTYHLTQVYQDPAVSRISSPICCLYYFIRLKYTYFLYFISNVVKGRTSAHTSMELEDLFEDGKTKIPHIFFRTVVWFLMVISTIISTYEQCCGSMTFWGGSGSRSGSADPCLWLMDPDPDPAIFVIDLPKMPTKN